MKYTLLVSWIAAACAVRLVPAPSDLPRVGETVDPKSPNGTQNTLVEKHCIETKQALIGIHGCKQWSSYKSWKYDGTDGWTQNRCMGTKQTSTWKLFRVTSTIHQVYIYWPNNPSGKIDDGRRMFREFFMRFCVYNEKLSSVSDDRSSLNGNNWNPTTVSSL